MKNKLILLVLCCSCWSGYSQDVFVKTGKNFVDYSYTSSDGVVNPYLQSDTGSSYEIGYSFAFKKMKRFSYDISLTLNEFNAIVGVPESNVQYRTEYAGLQNSLSYSLIKFNRFALDATTGFNVSTIVYGKQAINGVLFDLNNLDGFKQVLVSPIFGLEANFYASKQLYLSLGYRYIKSMSTVKNPQEFRIQSNQFMLGVHFCIEPLVNNNFKKK
jgi:hypothetical protein